MTTGCIRRLLVAQLIAMLAVAAVGCQSSQSSSTTLPGPLGTSMRLYEAGDYAGAERDAASLAARSGGTARARASYVAGLAAYKQGEPLRAEQYLSAATHSADRATTGRANAMLGVIALAASRNLQAASYFDRAAEDLTGLQRDHAQRYARKARLGISKQATAGSERRGSPSGRFCLQAGAFRDRSRASRTSQQLEPLAREAGLGQVRVVPAADTVGRPLYLVQMGGFHTRSEATRAREAIGRLDFIVASCDL